MGSERSYAYATRHCNHNVDAGDNCLPHPHLDGQCYTASDQHYSSSNSDLYFFSAASNFYRDRPVSYHTANRYAVCHYSSKRDPYAANPPGSSMIWRCKIFL